MTGPLTAVILISLLSQNSGTPQQISVSVREPGEEFTLLCPVTDGSVGLFYWYKLKFGYSIQTVAAGTFDRIENEKEFDESRFRVTYKDNLYSATIANVSKEDEATYLCQAGTAYEMTIVNSSLLAVNDHKKNQKKVYVKQKPETQWVQEGGNVSLQCSLLSQCDEERGQCPGENHVFWFRAGSGLSSGVLYTQRETRKDGEQEGEGEGEQKEEEGEEEERSCVYSLAPSIQTSSDAGTFYCAVFSCGRILFGEGTTVHTKQTPWAVYVALLALLPCCVCVAAAVILHRHQRTVCRRCRGGITTARQAELDTSAEGQAINEGGEDAALNYVALNFQSRKTQRGTTSRDSPQESTYAGVQCSL